MRKSDSSVIIFLVIIGLPLFLFQKMADAIGVNNVVGCILLAILLFAIYRIIKAKRRENYLLEKYKDPDIVKKILVGACWQGQSAEQLKDSLGQPEDIDQKLMKTRSREVWKYNRNGVNRYGLRVTLDDQIVTGWDKKD